MSRKSYCHIIENENGIKYNSRLTYPDIPLDDDDFYFLSKQGDRLDNLANTYLSNPHYWYILLLANPGKLRRDTLQVPEGIQLRVPYLINDFFKKLQSLKDDKEI